MVPSDGRAEQMSLMYVNRVANLGHPGHLRVLLPSQSPRFRCGTRCSSRRAGCRVQQQTKFRGICSMDKDILAALEQRLGRLHARQRLGIETDHEAQIFGQGLTFFHLENWYPGQSLIRTALNLTGHYWRARRNAGRVVVRSNDIAFKDLPARFDGFTILHLSDLHVDMSEAAMQRVCELVGELRYDLCVLTGDYRGKTFGPFEAALDGVARVRSHLKGPIYGVLGNHDTIRMVPALEAMDIRILLNECELIARDDQRIYLPALDHPHSYPIDTTEKPTI